MIFPEFKGKVWGIWDNGQQRWSHDSHGVLFAGTQETIIDAQVNSMNGFPVYVNREPLEQFECRLIGDFEK